MESQNIFKKLFFININKAMAFFLLVFALLGIFAIGWKETLPQVGIALATAILLDIFFVYRKTKQIAMPYTAIITAFFVSTILIPGINWYIVFFATAAAILSKHLLRVNGRHIFNPSAFGLVFAMLFFNAGNAWWSSVNRYLLIIFGLYFMYRLRTYFITIPYFLLTAVLVGIHHYTQGAALLNTFIIINYFFMLFMLIEPKTVPFTKKGKVIYALIIAVVSFILFAYSIPKIDPALAALLVGNIAVPLLNKRR